MGRLWVRIKEETNTLVTALRTAIILRPPQEEKLLSRHCELQKTDVPPQRPSGKPQTTCQQNLATSICLLPPFVRATCAAGIRRQNYGPAPFTPCAATKVFPAAPADPTCVAAPLPRRPEV